MSIISQIYFSNKEIKTIDQLEKDKTVSVTDLSSRGFSHFALMDEELNYLLPMPFTKYKEERLIDKEEEGLIRLSAKFISDCAGLTDDQLKKANQAINQAKNVSALKAFNKNRIYYLPWFFKLLVPMMFGVSVCEFQVAHLSEAIIITLFFLSLLALIYFLGVYRRSNQEAKWLKKIQNKKVDVLPELKDMVKACQEAKVKGLSVYYYWSL